MERDSVKHGKRRSKKSSKKTKRRWRSHDGGEGSFIESNSSYALKSVACSQKIVEYSDVSSEDFSAPEAGEIQTEESDNETYLNKANNKNIDSKYHSNTIKSNKQDSSGKSISRSDNIRVTVESPAMSHSSATRLKGPVHILTNTSIQRVISSPAIAEEYDSESERKRKRKKEKKHKKTKKTKKRKKKRQKSVSSSIESISDNDSVLDGDNLTPPINSSPLYNTGFTSTLKEASPISPGTPPPRPNSTISSYSDTSRRTPGGQTSSISRSVKKRDFVSSPHTPPLAPKNNNDFDHHRYHHHYHHDSNINDTIVVKTSSPAVTHSTFSPALSKRRKLRERSYDRDYKIHYSGKSEYKDKIGRDKDYRDKEYEEKDWHKDKYGKRYSRSPSPIHHRSVNSSRSSRKRYYSPSIEKSRSSKLHSRSRSPRSFRNTTPTHKNNRGNSRSHSTSPSVSIRRIDLKEKLSDTSLFAELVKDKHKREKALKEILDKKDESIEQNASGENSLTSDGLVSNIPTIVDHFESIANGINQNSVSVDVVDIPIPESSSGSYIMDKHMIYAMNPDKFHLDTVSNFGNYGMPDNNNYPPPPPPPEPNMVDNTSYINNNKIVEVNKNTFLFPVEVEPSVKNTYTINKPKNLTKLPMPPGMNATDLEDVKSPSPPRNISPVEVKHHYKKLSFDGKPVKKGLLDLPMPMVPGFEELSGDDDINTPPRGKTKPFGFIKNNNSIIKRKRPQILQRKSSISGNHLRDWGERCVDVFEVIAQIGEGTYGQVRDISIILEVIKV